MVRSRLANVVRHYTPTRFELMRWLLRPTTRPDLVRLGSAYGGWWIPRDIIGAETVAYCAGAGEDISFDLSLHEAGCRVVTFDPTPRSIAYVSSVAPNDASFQFLPVGWWSEDTELRFFAPRDPRHVSHSIVNLQRTDEFFLGRVKPVWRLMEELGDTNVDLIKMDIEGAEYEVIGSLLKAGPLPAVLCVEFDQPQPLWRTFSAVMRLRVAGYSLAKIERWNCTFLRKPVGRRSLALRPRARPFRGATDSGHDL
ncbi:MAG: FkbM family methyltransferase [Acidimicrobiales bacterium]